MSFLKNFALEKKAQLNSEEKTKMEGYWRRTIDTMKGSVEMLSNMFMFAQDIDAPTDFTRKLSTIKLELESLYQEFQRLDYE